MLHSRLFHTLYCRLVALEDVHCFVNTGSCEAREQLSGVALALALGEMLAMMQQRTKEFADEALLLHKFDVGKGVR